ncbi:type VII secretion AAA-ATPase EccA [Gordonia hydrophobica]|uniref:Type VII secretion AAA-ATPase EccA n=1 Tax=Gordonia hydrophobica TaxID=40516 RepID=A0ABZ2U3Z4_9ACTN|nr:type VII secretion AAA-ATPase EccA [Gordonia hydrophobica]MBM7367876.1 type VII secretion ATPase EccA [Gordonia hydrophobica]
MNTSHDQTARVAAREYFAAGVGVLLGDAPPDRDRALRAFVRASEIDPTMGDAWLGRVAAGDRSGPCLLGLYRTRDSIGVSQRRLGVPAGHLVGHLPTGMFVDLPITGPVDAAAAYAASLLAGGDTTGARDALDLIDAPDDPSVAFCRALVALRTRRWPEVLDVVGSLAWPDDVLAAAADFLAGTACVHLGLFDEGLRRLERVRTSVLVNARAQALFLSGMALRTRGDEVTARGCLEEAFALDPGLAEARRALADPSYRLVVGEESTDRSAAAAAGTETALPSRSDDALRAVTDELAAQVGLAAVKDQVERLRATVTLAQIRAEKGLRTQSRSLHLAFTGPPGTGKTTIARLVARLYCALGLLTTDTVVEVSRRDLVGQHLGSTAPQTSAVIDSALDGVLLIDEAYTLVQEGLSGGDAFGREAIDTLLARMENDRDRLVVIIAGYDEEIDRLLAANEGLASRFARRIRFTSYTPGELTRIAEVLADRRDARLSGEAAAALSEAFTELYDDVVDTPAGPRRGTDVAGNGRFVRNVLEAAEEEREHRLAAGDDLAGLTDTELMTITASDVHRALATTR